jgi:hypothetical protein
MIRILSTLVLVTALAGPAMAQEARVSVSGKSDQSLHADIHKAAVKVCTEALSRERYSLQELYSCVDQAEADGWTQAKAIQQSQPSFATLTRSEPARQ